MEELASEEEAKNAGVAGGGGRPLTATEGEQEGIGAREDPGGAAAGGGAIVDATSKDAVTSGVGGRHGAG